MIKKTLSDFDLDLTGLIEDWQPRFFELGSSFRSAPGDGNSAAAPPDSVTQTAPSGENESFDSKQSAETANVTAELPLSNMGADFAADLVPVDIPEEEEIEFVGTASGVAPETPAGTNIIMATTIDQSGFIPPDPKAQPGQITWSTRPMALSNGIQNQEPFSTPKRLVVSLAYRIHLAPTRR